MELCWRAAERADDMAAALARFRPDVDREFAEDISELVRRMTSCSRVLKDLYDLAPVYRENLPPILEYLGIILPPFQRSLQAIRRHLSEVGLLPVQRIWLRIYNHLLEEGGVAPEERFRIYNDFIIQLVQRLSR